MEPGGGEIRLKGKNQCSWRIGDAVGTPLRPISDTYDDDDDLGDEDHPDHHQRERHMTDNNYDSEDFGGSG